MPLASRLRATKPALSDEQVQDTVDEATADPDQAGLPADRACIRVGSGIVGAAFRGVCVRGRVGMIDHADLPERVRGDVRRC